MKRPVYKTVILTVGVVIILIAGCGGGDTSKSETKRGRLIAAENRRLKKQVEKLEKELENQKEQFAKRLSEENLTAENRKLQRTNEELNAQVKQLEEELAKLKDSKKFKEWEKEVAETSLRTLEEIGRLREENEKLKKELEIPKGPTPLPHAE